MLAGSPRTCVPRSSGCSIQQRTRCPGGTWAACRAYFINLKQKRSKLLTIDTFSASAPSSQGNPCGHSRSLVGLAFVCPAKAARENPSEGGERTIKSHLPVITVELKSLCTLPSRMSKPGLRTRSNSSTHSLIFWDALAIDSKKACLRPNLLASPPYK
jgi:hypothetical protein